MSNLCFTQTCTHNKNTIFIERSDQFILQEDGYGRIVGRLKEMIIRGGENIFPKEIEDFLNTHPDICETHVCKSGFTLQFIPRIDLFKFSLLSGDWCTL